MTDTQKIKEASELGTKAFNEGRKAIPAWDKELTKLQNGLELGNKLNTKLLKAWLKAWHTANAEMLIA